VHQQHHLTNLLHKRGLRVFKGRVLKRWKIKMIKTRKPVPKQKTLFPWKYRAMPLTNKKKKSRRKTSLTQKCLNLSLIILMCLSFNN
jgi:hypothetical protein